VGRSRQADVNGICPVGQMDAHCHQVFPYVGLAANIRAMINRIDQRGEQTCTAVGYGFVSVEI
jgi:hypothetical protein